MNNLERRDYYVYGYMNEDGTFYYIGKGSKNRAYTRHERITVPGRELIVILVDNLTSDEAYDKETEYIRQIGRADQNKGPLLNLNDGGRGARGTFAQSTILKMKQRHATVRVSKELDYTLYNRPRKDRCVYEDCTEYIYTDGLCIEHYAREQENEYGRDFKPISMKNDPDYEEFIFVYDNGLQKASPEA